MMQNLKYTVLMSVYYKEKPEYLSLSIESMLNQTVKPDEFIIVKDGPLTTELDEVINNFVTAYPKMFNIIVNETNLGLGPALAKGIENSKNELIARMDSDDYVDRRMYAAMYTRAGSEELDLVECDFHYLEEDGREKRSYGSAAPWNKRAEIVVIKEADA